MKRAGRWLGGAMLTSLVVAGSAGAQTPAPNTRVTGVAYFQFSEQLADTAGHGNNFDVTRAYVNVLGSFAQGVGSRVTADIFRNGDGALAYRLKYAFVSLKPDHGDLAFKLGLVATPWIEWEEGLWGYRMQGTVPMDRNGYLTSSDLGAAVDASWQDHGVSLQAGVFDGEGYSKAPGDRRKDVAARLSFRLAASDETGKTGGLRFTAFGLYGTPTGGGIRQRVIGMLSYHSHRATLAAQLARTVDSSTTAASARVTGSVASLYGVLRFPRSPIGLVGRIDAVDPNTGAAGDRRTRYIAGVSYKVSSNLLLLGDLDHLTYEGGSTTPALEAGRSNALFQVQVSF